MRARGVGKSEPGQQRRGRPRQSCAEAPGRPGKKCNNASPKNHQPPSGMATRPPNKVSDARALIVESRERLQALEKRLEAEHRHVRTARAAVEASREML